MDIPLGAVEKLHEHYGRIFDGVSFSYKILRYNYSECLFIVAYNLTNTEKNVELVRVYIDDEGEIIVSKDFNRIVYDNDSMLGCVADIIKNFCTI